MGWKSGIFVSAVFALILIFLSVNASALQYISGCQDITIPDTYVLTRDLPPIKSYPSDPGPPISTSCIYIGNNNIILDGAGYNIACEAGITTGVYVSNVNGITVKNLKISNCADRAIIFSGTSGTPSASSIEGNTLYSNGDGIKLSSATNIQVKNNVMFSNTKGVLLSGASNTQINNKQACGNTYDYYCELLSSSTSGSGNELKIISKPSCSDNWPTAADYIPCNYQISSCKDIKIPGIYNLMNDITAPARETCINVLADNVIINGRGWKIQGDSSAATAGISAISKRNITINGTFIKGFDSGIYLEKVNNISIINNTLASNTYQGIGVYEGFNVSINNNNISWNNQWGVILSSVGNSSILFNIISHNSLTGIIAPNTGSYIEGNLWNNISYNNISYNGRDGISIEGNKNFIFKNNVSKNSGKGVVLEGGNQIKENGQLVTSGRENKLNDNFACSNTLNDFECNNALNTFGSGNYFTSVQQCVGGWPQPAINYNLCPPFLVETCIDFIDNDNDNLFDMADTNGGAENCHPSLCSVGKQVTYQVAGNVNLSDIANTPGIPWNTGVNPNKFPANTAWCCAANECFLYRAGCQGNNFIIITPSLNFTCSANGNSAVLCKGGFVNDGNGNCVCPLGTIYDSSQGAQGKCVTSGGICNFNGRCESGETFCSCQSDCYNPQVDCTGVSNLAMQASCSQFKTEDACNNWINLPEDEKNLIFSSIQEHSLIENNFCFDRSYTFEAASSGDPNNPESCGTYVRCDCYWSNMLNTCLERTSKVSTQHENFSCNVLLGEDAINICLTISTLTPTGEKCELSDDDEYQIIWNSIFQATLTSPPVNEGNPDMGCASGSRPLPCPLKTKLPFFTLFNLIISILTIGTIYYLIVRKKIKFI